MDQSQQFDLLVRQYEIAIRDKTETALAVCIFKEGLMCQDAANCAECLTDYCASVHVDNIKNELDSDGVDETKMQLLAELRHKELLELKGREIEVDDE